MRNITSNTYEKEWDEIFFTANHIPLETWISRCGSLIDILKFLYTVELHALASQSVNHVCMNSNCLNIYLQLLRFLSRLLIRNWIKLTTVLINNYWSFRFRLIHIRDYRRCSMLRICMMESGEHISYFVPSAGKGKLKRGNSFSLPVPSLAKFMIIWFWTNLKPVTFPINYQEWN